MKYSTLTAAEYHDCVIYEHQVNAQKFGGPPPIGNVPAKYHRYLTEDLAKGADPSKTQFRNPPFKPAPENVNMPADTLEMIIRTIGAMRPYGPPAVRPPPPTHPN